MSYLTYLVMAYAVFVAVLLWDFIAPRLQLRAARALARRRMANRGQRTPAPAQTELQR